MGDLVMLNRAIERLRRASEDRESEDLVARMDADNRALKRTQNLDRAGVLTFLQPRMAHAVAREAFELTPVMRRVQLWLDGVDGAQMLVILGTKGRGKTVGMAHALASIGGLYVKAGDIAGLVATTGIRAMEARAPYLRTRLLAVDDVGTEPTPEMMEASMYAVTDARQGLRTIMCANMTQNRLMASCDARTQSRLHGASFVEDFGQDMRMVQP